MKHKDKLISSLIIAFVAGFIYYAFADFDTIKKIPYLAYETFKSAIEPKEAPEENTPVTPEKKKQENLYASELNTPVENGGSDGSALKDIILSYLPDFSKYLQVPDFGGGMAYAPYVKVPKEHMNDFGFNSDFGPSMIRLADYNGYDPFDSNEVIVKLKIKSLDSLNIYLDESMSKLNDALSKLNEQLNSEEFLKALPHFDSDDFKVDIDKDELRKEIEESMEDYKDNMEDMKENMKDLKFDLKSMIPEMKGFKIDSTRMKFDMQEFKDSMKEFEENMKEYQENMQEYKENMKEFKENMKDLKKKMKDMDTSRMKRIEKEKQIEIIES
ncbi:MAG: hypothetical protein LWX07_04885 [Bacteroidetes bacterium]|nr:hypothetical protein [Bacteroidota bacterium]